MRVSSLVQTLAGILCLYVIYCGFLFLIQRRLVFPRHLTKIPAEAPEIPGIEPLWLDMPFGRTEAWFLPPRQGVRQPAPAVLFAHGNAELIDHWPEDLAWFTHWGIGVLLVEYPGYGRSQGRPSQARVIDTFTAAYDRLVSRPDVDPSQIVLFGRSLGGGAVCALAARRPSAGLILLSTFTSVRALSGTYLAPGFLVRDVFDNLSVLQSYEQPALIVHGPYDPIVPYDHAVALARAAPHGRLITDPACRHTDCPSDWTFFRQEVRKFLTDAGIRVSTPSGL